MKGLTVVRFLAFVLVAGGLLWLIDNGDSEQTPAASPAAPSATPSASRTAVTPTPSATTEPAPAPEQSADEDVPARDEVKDRRGARIELAERAARAFANPGAGATREQWWEGLRPQIAERYQSDFDYIDPQEVPYTRVTGDGRQVKTTAPETLLTLVRVPTDAGPYSVEIEDAQDGPRVTAIYPSEE